jgi:hypothetical protein
LNQLKLPASVRFAAGFVHEAQPLEDQVRIRTIIEEHLGRTVVIASACGLGRRTDEAARLVLERTAELCAD